MFMSFQFKETPRPKDQKPIVSLFYNGKQLGDSLDDNSDSNLFIRYHDDVHLGLFALCNWSPVMDELLGNESKVPPLLSPIAKMILHLGDTEQEINSLYTQTNYQCRLEENIVFLNYNEALHKGFYEKRKPSASIVNITKQLAEGTPLGMMSKEEISENIVKIFDVHRQLITNRSGYIDIDPEKKFYQFRVA